MQALERHSLSHLTWCKKKGQDQQVMMFQAAKDVLLHCKQKHSLQIADTNAEKSKTIEFLYHKKIIIIPSNVCAIKPNV